MGRTKVIAKVFVELATGRAAFVQTGGQHMVVMPLSHVVGALPALLVFAISVRSRR